MAVRAFDGVDDLIDTATGALATNTFGTFAVIVKRGATGEWHTFLALHNSGGSALNQFAYESSNLSALWSDGTTRTGPAAVGTADWGLVVVRKGSGTVAARFSLYNFTTATWTHGNASGTGVNWTAPGTGGTVRTRWQTFDLLQGRLAVRGAWNTVKWAADTSGDAAIEAAGLHLSLQNWVDATPSALWSFDQADVGTAVTDLTGGGADQTSIVGTSVVTGDDPPGFSFTSSPVTYHISAAGSDAADGLTPETAWQTLNPHYSVTFAPGDSLLLRGGDTFTGLVYLAQAGTAVDPITIGSYGTGRATITNTNNSAIYLDNVGGVEVSDLILTGGTGATAYDGLSAYRGTSGRVTHLRISNVDAAGWKYGIAVGGDAGGGYSDVVIDVCTATGNVAGGIFVYGPAWTGPTYAHTGVTITACRAYDNPGDAANTTGHSGSGIVVGSTDAALVERCTAYGNGELNAFTGGGPAGIWTYDSNDVHITRCVAYSNRTGTTADGDGFDLDINTSNSSVTRCIAYDNHGAGVLIFTAAADDAHTGNVVSDNICWGNSTNDPYYGEIKVAGRVNDCDIHSNTLVANSAGTVHPPVVSVHDTGLAGVRLRNNVLVQRGTTAPVVRAENVGLDATDALFQGNAYQATAGGLIDWGGTAYGTLAAWRAAVTGQEAVAGSPVGYVGDVGLADVATTPAVTDSDVLTPADTLRLTSSSAVADTGLDLAGAFGLVIGPDFFGATRTDPWSVGAAEQDVAPPTTTPAEILNIGATLGRNHFDLQLGREGDSFFIVKSQAEIEAGYDETPYFTVNAAGDAVQMHAPADAPAITSDQARVELRELDESGANQAFDPFTGTHYMQGVTRITHHPDDAVSNIGITLAQLHNGSVDRLTFRTQFVSTTLRLRFRVNGSAVAGGPGSSLEIVPAGAGNIVNVDLAWRIQVVDGVASFFINDDTTPWVTSTALVPTTAPQQWYFKAGCYNQFTAAQVGADDFGQVELRELEAWHTGYADPIPPGDPPLAVDDARSASRAGAPLLTQHSALTADPARAVSRAISATLAHRTVLTVDGARSPSRATSATVAQTSPVVVGGARSSSRATAPLLAQQHPPLTVDGARALSRAADAALTHRSVLAVDGTRSPARADDVLLAQQHAPLVVDGARAATRAGDASLTQIHPLTVAGARSGSVAEDVTLAQVHDLTVDGARSASRSDDALLALSGSLVVAGARAQSRASTPALGQSSPLAVDGARAVSRATAPLLAQASPLTVAPARSTSRAGAVAVTQSSPLTVNGARSVTRAGGVLLVGPDALLVHPTRSASRASAPLLAQRSVLAVDPARAVTRAAAPVLAVLVVLDVDGARSATRAVPVLVDQHSLLVVAGARAPSRAGRVLLPGGFVPTPPAERTLFVVAEQRRLVVAAEPRTLHVPPAPRTLHA